MWFGIVFFNPDGGLHRLPRFCRAAGRWSSHDRFKHKIDSLPDISQLQCGTDLVD